MKKLNWRLAWSHSARFCFCPTQELWDAERTRVLKRANVDIQSYPCGNNTGMTTIYRDGDTRIVVALSEQVDDEPALLVGTLAHEAVHVANAIFESMAEKSPGEETMAYTVGRVTAELFLDYTRTRGGKLKELADGR